MAFAVAVGMAADGEEASGAEVRGVAPCLSQGFGGDAMWFECARRGVLAGFWGLGSRGELTCGDAGQGFPGGDQNGSKGLGVGSLG